jgi:hypothetical protein
MILSVFIIRIIRITGSDNQFLLYGYPVKSVNLHGSLSLGPLPPMGAREASSSYIISPEMILFLHPPGEGGAERRKGAESTEFNYPAC